jgi:hypothetical protein
MSQNEKKNKLQNTKLQVVFQNNFSLGSVLCSAGNCSKANKRNRVTKKYVTNSKAEMYESGT